jgi:hypothetical protein
MQVSVVLTLCLLGMAPNATSCRSPSTGRDPPPTDRMEEVRAAHLRASLEVRYVGGLRSGVILAAWSNGLVLVSANLREGGPPYRCITQPEGSIEQASARILELLKRGEGPLSDTGPDAPFTRLCVQSDGSRTCISSMNLSFAGDLVARSPVARKEFEALWLDVCLEASALDSGGGTGVAPPTVDALLGQ